MHAGIVNIPKLTDYPINCLHSLSEFVLSLDFDRWLDSLTDVEDVGQYTIVLLPEGSLLQATSVMATKRTAYARMHAGENLQNLA